MAMRIPSSRPKFIQIASCDGRILALDGRGIVYILKNGEWQRLPHHPMGDK